MTSSSWLLVVLTLVLVDRRLELIADLTPLVGFAFVVLVGVFVVVLVGVVASAVVVVVVQ